MARIIQLRGCKIVEAIVLFLLITTGFLSTAVAGYIEVELPRDSIEGDYYQLGYAIDIYASTVVVGAPGWIDGSDRGRAFVYGQEDDKFVLLAELVPSNPTGGYEFGKNVVIRGDTIIVTTGYTVNVFVRPQNGWSGTVYDAASFHISLINGAKTIFDVDIGINDVNREVIVVGIDLETNKGGNVSVFVEPSGGWSGDMEVTRKLRASYENPYYGPQYHRSVAIYGKTIVTGYGHGYYSGKYVYVYSRPTEGWRGAEGSTALSPSATIDCIGSHYECGGWGSELDVDSDTIVVGGLESQNLVFVYNRPSGGWSGLIEAPDALLKHSTSSTTYRLGKNIKIYPNFIEPYTDVIIADFYDNTSLQKPIGVYEFHEPSYGWSLIQTQDSILPFNEYTFAKSVSTYVAGRKYYGIGRAFAYLPDSDNDGVADVVDNCIDTINSDQADSDGDGYGDVCDDDNDNDGVDDDTDNCPYDFNPDQPDCDADGIGDACATDTDGDGWPNACDNCPDFPARNQDDIDFDGIGDLCDNCPSTPNSAALGTCEPSAGNAGAACISNEDCTGSCGSSTNCIMEQVDSDFDSYGDVCDNCPDNCNTQQLDADEDGIGDVCDETPGCDGCGQSDCEQECNPGCGTVDRFLDNGDGTVTDCTTDLLWLKDANCFGALDWDTATVYIPEGVYYVCGVYGGAGDWRLPTKEELQGIGTDPPTTWVDGPPPVTWTMPDLPFTNVIGSEYYWSSTEEGTVDAWATRLIDGTTLWGYKDFGLNVWPVRDAN
jgi:hypothetical protein